MLRVLLVNGSFPPHEGRFAAQSTPLSPPLGLLSIAAALTHAGFEIDLVDPQVDDDYERHIEEAVGRGPVFVGMTTFMGPNIANVRAFSSQVKALSPDTPVVWGGPLATSSPEICLTDPNVDYVVMGMGEASAVRLARSLADARDPGDLPHVSSRRPASVHVAENYRFEGSLDDLDLPRLDLWEAGIRAAMKIPILSSRGCPRNCAFCYNNTFNGRKRWYGRSADDVLAEMAHWSERFGLGSFYFVDDNFLIDCERACRIIDESRARGYRIGQVIGHLSDFRPPVLKRIAHYIGHAGFSIESASPRIQRVLNKRVDPRRAVELIRTLTALGIDKITTNFMFGIPTEDDGDIAASIALAAEIRAIDPRVRMVPYIYCPQPEDDIVRHLDLGGPIPFSLDTLSQVDFAPNRSRVLVPDLHPWLSHADREFYLDLVQIWFYHFDHVVRADQDIPVGEIVDRDARIARLFAAVHEPV